MLNVLTPSKITKVFQDDGTKAHLSLSVFQADLAAVPDNCYIVGQVGLRLHTAAVPVSSVFLVSPVGEDLVKQPVGYTLMWNDNDLKGADPISFWQVLPPKHYVALGDVAYPGFDEPPDAFTKKYACIHEDLVAQGKLNDDPIWTDHGSGAHLGLSIWQVENGKESGDWGLAGFFKAARDYSKPQYNVYVLPVKATKTE